MPPRPFVLGLAGGIGSGKSAAAAALAARGAYIIDFDREARAALDRPEVARALEQRWGRAIFTPGGAVDRAAVAARVFGQPAERAWLESLIHPLIWRTRDQAVAEARAHASLLAVMDAPLLFEAGLDRECDAVLFIEADRAARLERVRQTRGWDEPELDRREQAQLPLEAKRAASRWVVRNQSDPAELAVALGRIFDMIVETTPGEPS